MPTINPFWEIVRKLPPDDLMSQWDDRWRPASFGCIRDANGDYEMVPSMPTRTFLTREYAWAIPSPKSLAFIVDALNGQPLLEVGAGTGYWAWQLSQLGVDVVAYDKQPPDQAPNWFHSPRSRQWHEYTDKDREAKAALWRPLVEAYESWKTLPVSEGQGPIPSPPVLEPLEGGAWQELPDPVQRRDVFYPVLRGDESVAAQHPDRALFLCWPPYDDPMAFNALRAYRGDVLIYCGEGEGGCTASDAFFNRLEEEWEEVGVWELPQWSGIHDLLTVFRRKPSEDLAMRAALSMMAGAL